MRKQRFDILPIVSGTEVKKYFRTDKQNDYSSISEKSINHQDVIPFHTHIRDVIKGLASESRNFYFLHNERRIVGLISDVNLNCRQVKVYLFSLLSELEIRLGHFITEHILEDELVKLTFGKDVKEHYEEDKMKGKDVPFVEYLYLSNLINIIVKQKLCAQLGYSQTAFGEELGSLNNLRNDVAHPVHSIITERDTVKKLWERIDRVEKALFVLG